MMMIVAVVMELVEVMVQIIPIMVMVMIIGRSLIQEEDYIKSLHGANLFLIRGRSDHRQWASHQPLTPQRTVTNRINQWTENP